MTDNLSEVVVIRYISAEHSFFHMNNPFPVDCTQISIWTVIYNILSVVKATKVWVKTSLLGPVSTTRKLDLIKNFVNFKLFNDFFFILIIARKSSFFQHVSPHNVSRVKYYGQAHWTISVWLLHLCITELCVSLIRAGAGTLIDTHPVNGKFSRDRKRSQNADFW